MTPEESENIIKKLTKENTQLRNLCMHYKNTLMNIRDKTMPSCHIKQAHAKYVDRVADDTFKWVFGKEASDDNE